LNSPGRLPQQYFIAKVVLYLSILKLHGRPCFAGGYILISHFGIWSCSWSDAAPAAATTVAADLLDSPEVNVKEI